MASNTAVKNYLSRVQDRIDKEKSSELWKCIDLMKQPSIKHFYLKHVLSEEDADVVMEALQQIGTLLPITRIVLLQSNWPVLGLHSNVLKGALFLNLEQLQLREITGRNKNAFCCLGPVVRYLPKLKSVFLLNYEQKILRAFVSHVGF